MGEDSQSIYQVCTQPDYVFVKVNGRASYVNCDPFRRFLHDVLADGQCKFVFDFADCSGLDSTFLGILMGMTGRLNRIELLNPRDRIIDLLDNLGVLELLTVGQGTNPFDAELTPADPVNTDKRSLTAASLEAHKLLMKINPENVPRFKDVAKFLEEDLERQ